MKTIKSNLSEIFIIILIVILSFCSSIFLGSFFLFKNKAEATLTYNKPETWNSQNLSLTIQNLENSNFNRETNQSNYSISKEDKKPSVISATEWLELKIQIELILNSDVNKYSLWLWDLERNQGLVLNSEIIRKPASISKLPYAIQTLQTIQSGNYTLQSTFPLYNYNKAYESDSLYWFSTRSNLSLQTYLEYLIKESDNTAMTSLEDFLGGFNQVNQNTKNILQINNLSRQPHTTTAKDVGILLQNLYNKQYLNQELTDFLIFDLLAQTRVEYSDRIVAGIPENLINKDVIVAHKIGEIFTDNGLAYHDAGIVYGKTTDYVLVVLNQDIQPDSASQKISEISSIIYQTLDQ